MAASDLRSLPSVMTVPRKAQSLGNYRLVRKLGAGGMAEVFLAAQTMEGGVVRPVVIKAIFPHLAGDKRFVRMFMREARVAALLSHPNIVHIHDVAKLEGRPCIIMEFLRGRDLWTVLERVMRTREPVPPYAAAAITAQVASALDYAHRKRDRHGRSIDLVHRDISPHNIFITREGQVRVLDFGIAKSRYQQDKTASGVIKGKLPYMSPEQARGKEVDHRTDQFALGVVLWEMLTGQRLFAREDAMATMAAMFHEPPKPPSSVRAVPEILDRICLRALQRHPTDRFESCERLAQKLRTWLASEEAGSENELVKRFFYRMVPSREDRDFYAPDRPQEPGAPSEEILLVPQEPTPPHGEPMRTRKRSRSPGEPPAPPSLTTTMRIKLRGRGLALAAGAVAVLTMVGATIAMSASSDTDAAEASADGLGAAAAVPEAVTVRFVRVPSDVAIEVDGAFLDGPELKVLPSDSIHRVRVFRAERELWRYDAIFREDVEVELPDLP